MPVPSRALKNTRRSLGTCLLAAVSALATPASAEAWKTTDSETRIVAAQIALPVKAGTTALVQTLEATHKGQGIDDVAQFESADGEVFATAYVFLAPGGDAALATLATDRAIHQRFGPAAALTSNTVVPAGALSNGAIRRAYAGGTLKPGVILETTAAFIHAGPWMVVLRATGPIARAAEVDGAVDALVTGARFGKYQPLPVTLPTVTAPCPPLADADAPRAVKEKNSGAAVLGAALFSIPLDPARGPKTNGPPLPPVFPADGGMPLCVRGTVKPGFDLFQGSNGASGRLILLLDDAGGLVTVEHALVGDSYIVKHYGIGFFTVLGGFAAIPSLAQLRAILDGSDQEGSTVRARVTLGADGNVSTAIDPDSFK